LSLKLPAIAPLNKFVGINQSPKPKGFHQAKLANPRPKPKLIRYDFRVTTTDVYSQTNLSCTTF
jgi:hypothetical protein